MVVIFKLDIGMVSGWGNGIMDMTQALPTVSESSYEVNMPENAKQNGSWIRNPICNASRAYSPTDITDTMIVCSHYQVNKHFEQLR